MRIGYLGPEGTFSEQAARRLAGETGALLVPLESLVDVVQAVQGGRLDRGVLPVENSGEGSVTLTLDLLAFHSDGLEICAELVLPIRHHLLARLETAVGEVHTVVSHPQALAQCRIYLTTEYPGAVLREVASTADAARLVAGSEPGLAAIGTELAAELYGLQVLGRDIADLRTNETRFLVLGPTGCRTGRPEKTSLVVSGSDHPGSLYLMLGEFARRGISLTRIESRPARTGLGRYIFFIDLIGSVDDPEVQAALTGLVAHCGFVRVLGSYPASTGHAGDAAGDTRVADISDVRRDIDLLDDLLVELLAKRAALVRQIGTLKAGTTVRDPKREAEILERLKQLARHRGMNPELVTQVYRVLLSYYVQLQVEQQSEAGASLEHSSYPSPN
ncbi:MAG: prephenate dehydratase [Desulforudis sp.]|nr:MAG: prephenate dehydratase [Desulforudis sp.]